MNLLLLANLGNAGSGASGVALVTPESRTDYCTHLLRAQSLTADGRDSTLTIDGRTNTVAANNRTIT